MAGINIKISLTDRVSRQLNNVNKSFQRVTNSTNSLNKTVRQTNKSFNDVVSTVRNVNGQLRLTSAINLRPLKNQVDGLNKSLKDSAKSTNFLVSKLKWLASVYLGVMGLRAVFNSSDAITKAENKINYLNNYEVAQTQADLDKMFVSAEKVRTGYLDMVTNVSKSMTLAGKSFNNNIDNAIRFQEIMSEAYTLGGASIEEQASSMYQMIQALGSGVLQGDELKSVREGASLAYKEIEKFAQGIYETTDSLKDMASEGMITSDVVVAGILKAGDAIDEAFVKTDITFEQFAVSLKNNLIKGFEPFLQGLNDIINSESGKFIRKEITDSILELGRVASKVTTILQNLFDTIANNWDTVKTIFLFMSFLIGGLLVNSIARAIIMFVKFASFGNLTVFGVISAIAFLIAYIYDLAKASGDVADAIGTALYIIGFSILAVLAMVAIGYTIMSKVVTSAATPMAVANIIAFWPLWLVVGILLVLTALFLKFTETIMGGLYVIGAAFKNFGLSVANIFIGIHAMFVVLWHNFKEGWKESIVKVTGFFNGLAADALNVIVKIAEALNKLPFVEFDYSGLVSKANAFAAVEAAAKGYEADYGDPLKAAANGFNYYDTWKDGWVDEAFNKGKEKGASIRESINGWFSDGSARNGLAGFSKINPGGVNLDDMLNKLDDISNNTDSMAKSMDLTEEDLKYLRQIAEMEAINKFTTAEIKVEMQNNNQINNTTDLDGIVTHLSRTLREEMQVLADGVHA